MNTFKRPSSIVWEGSCEEREKLLKGGDVLAHHDATYYKKEKGRDGTVRASKEAKKKAKMAI